MKGYMFQSRSGALAFVALTLVGVVALVGTERDEGALTAAAEQLEQQRAGFDATAEAIAAPNPDRAPIMIDPEPEAEWASDEELILDPVGIEPTPMEPNPEANEAEVVVVEPGESEIAAE